MDERAGDGRPDPHDRQRAAQQRATPHRERIATQRGGFRADEAVDPARRPAKHRVAAAGSPVFPPRSIVHVSRVKIAPGSVPSSTAATPASGPAIRCERPAQTPARRDSGPASRGIRLRRRRPRRSPGGRPPAHRRTARRLRRDRRRTGAAADGRPPAGPAPAGSRASGKPRRRAVRAVDERGTHDPEVDRQRLQEAVGCGLAREVARIATLDAERRDLITRRTPARQHAVKSAHGAARCTASSVAPR